MTHPGISRAFAVEYQEATGKPVESLMLDPFRKLICEDYVKWLEAELEKARGKA